MSICKDCIHYEICDPYVSPHESFPEVEGGCRCFKDKSRYTELPEGAIILTRAEIDALNEYSERIKKIGAKDAEEV